MSDALQVGARLRSATCATEMVVIKAPSGPTDVCCGGAPMVLAGVDVEPAPLDPAFAAGSVLGKRYADETTGAELLCVKPGAGSLSIDGRPLPLKDAKPLPASD